MQFTNGVREGFDEWLNTQAPAPEDPSLLARAGYGIVTAPARAGSNMVESIARLLGGGSHADAELSPEGAEQQSLMSLPEAKTFGAKATDFVTQGLVPMGIEMALTGKATNAMLPAELSAFPIAKHAIVDAAQLGQIGLHEDRTTALEQAGEGLGYGATRALSRTGRILPVAALAYLSKLFFDRNGEDHPISSLPGASTGDIAGTIGGMAAMLGGKLPWREAIPDHFATVAKPLELMDRDPRLALEDRAIEGHLMPEPAPEGTPQLRAGPGEFHEGTIYAGGEGTPGYVPMGGAPQLGYPEAQQLLGGGRPGRPALTYEGGVVQDYGNIGQAEMQARVPRTQVGPGSTVVHTNPNYEGSMEIIGEAPGKPGFWQVRHPSGKVGEIGQKAVVGAPPVIPMPDGPGVWSPEANRQAISMMQDWGEQFGIARDQMQKLSDAFDIMGVRDHNAKVALLWKQIQKGLHETNVEADFNPLRSRLGAPPEAQVQLDEAAQIAKADSRYASGQELQRLQNESLIKGKVGISQAEQQLAEMRAADNEAAWRVRDANKQLLRYMAGLETPRDPSPSVKAKVHELPEFKRTQGGFAAEDLIMPLGRATVGGLLGGAAGGEEGALAGAAAGLTPEVLRLLLGAAKHLKGGDEAGMVRDPFFEKPIGKKRIISTAIKLPDGQLVTGEKWNSKHNTLISEALDQPGTDHNIMDHAGFMIEDANQNIRWASRLEAADIARETGQAGQGYRGKSLISEELVDPNPAPTAQEQKLRAFAKGQQASIAEKAEQNYNHFDYDLQPGDTVHSTTSGKTYTFVDKGFPAKNKEGVRDPRIKLKGEDGEIADYRLVNQDGSPAWSKSADKLQPVRSFEGLQRLQKGEQAHVFPELTAAMGRAVIGGLAGGSLGALAPDTVGFPLGAFIGAGLATFGPAASRALTKSIAEMKTNPKAAATAVKDASSWATRAAKNAGQVVEEMSGRAFSASSSGAERFVRWLDRSFDLTIPPILKEALIKSKGVAANMMDNMDQAMQNVAWRFKQDPVMVKSANEFLTGAKTQKQFYEEVAQAFPKNQQMKNYADFVVSARTTMDGLSEIIADGATPKMAKIIRSNFGKYVTRSFKIFTDPKWEPTQESIRNLIGEVRAKGLAKGATDAQLFSQFNQYVREVKQSKGMYRGDHSPQGQEVSQMLFNKRKDLSKEWRQFLGEITDPTERVYQTVFRLRPMAEASGYFSAIAKNVKEDGWLPHYFNNYQELGAFENQLLQRLQNTTAGTAENIEAAARLDKFRLKWEGPQNVDNHPKFGDLSNGVVTRNVWDTLKTYDSMTDQFKSPLMRAGMNFHTAVKLGRTAFNPITVVRNFVTMPMFMSMARVGVQDVRDAHGVIMAATPEMKALREEIMKMGIGNVDQVRTEFFKEFERTTGSRYNFGDFDMTSFGLGKIDLNVAEQAGRRGIRKILDIYRYPDNLIRIGSYLGAKRRFAESLGMSINSQEVMDAAARFTNRYTMNYDSVAPAVKFMRQLPFFNLFITYTSEMLRIMKNLSVDLVKGTDGISHDRLYAAFPLSFLAAIPEIAQTASEGSLSPSDKKDWDKAKQLMPDYGRTRYRYVTGRDKKTGEFHYIDFTQLIASDAINQTVKALAAGDKEALLAVNPIVGMENTPLLNIASSQIVGKDLRTHREFRGPFLSAQNTADRFATIAKEALPPLTPGVGSEAVRAAQAYTTNAEGTLGVTNSRTGYKVTPQDFWTPYWSGVRTGSTSLNTLQQKSVAEAKQEIVKETAYLKDIVQSDLPLEKKHQALEKFKVVVGEIQENLRQLLETNPTSNSGGSSAGSL